MTYWNWSNFKIDTNNEHLAEEIFVKLESRRSRLLFASLNLCYIQFGSLSFSWISSSLNLRVFCPESVGLEFKSQLIYTFSRHFLLKRYVYSRSRLTLSIFFKFIQTASSLNLYDLAYQTEFFKWTYTVCVN